MASDMTKQQASQLLALLQAFVDRMNAEMPGMILTHPHDLLALHELLTKEMRELVDKSAQVLTPRQGQRLTPEAVAEQIAQLFWQSATALRFASSVMYDQAFRISKLEERLQNLSASAAAKEESVQKKSVQRQPKSARKTKPRRT